MLTLPDCHWNHSGRKFQTCENNELIEVKQEQDELIDVPEPKDNVVQKRRRVVNDWPTPAKVSRRQVEASRKQQKMQGVIFESELVKVKPEQDELIEVPYF